MTLLALVALLVPAGRWSGRYGRKLVYLYGFVRFTAASAVRAGAGADGLVRLLFATMWRDPVARQIRKLIKSRSR